MSRIGRQAIEIPKGVQVDIAGEKVTIKGPKGTLNHNLVKGISLKIEDNKIWVSRDKDIKRVRAFHGMTRALLANAVSGVSKEFEKKLELVGVGYRAALAGRTLNLSLGFSHPVEVKAPEGIVFTVEGQNVVTIKGIDRQKVGQIAADIRSIREVEPYKGKGIRYSGEIVRKKAGKAAKTAA